MTVEQDRVAVGAPRARYLAALAVVSNGRPLEADQRAIFARLAAEESLDDDLREELATRAAGGVVAADVPALPREDRLAAITFVLALTQLCLGVARERPDMAAVPDALAREAGLPRYLIAHAALSLESPDPTDLRANLLAFFYPSSALQALAREQLAAEGPARPPKRSVARVSPQRYQHPQDRAGIELINGIAGFDDLTRLIFEHGFEKAFRVMNLSSCVRVSERQFPELYATYLDVVARVGVRPVPELYLKPGGINAHTSGVERPYVMLDAGAVGSLTRDELEFIIGHELGHIRCQHMLHLFVANVIPYLAQAIPVAGKLIGFALEMAIGDWRRKAEFSCDRVGLLACQDLEAAQRVMIKWSGVPSSLYPEIDMEAFLDQNREFEQLDADVMSLVIKLMVGANRTHPWTVQRVAELKRWHDEGDYATILAQGAPAATEAPTFLPLPALPAMAFRCAVCNTTFSLMARSCPQCGAPPREADRVRRCAACGEVCAEDTTYCTACTDPAARRARLAPRRALDGPPLERLRALMARLGDADSGLGLGPLAREPLAALADPAASEGHLMLIVGQRGRGQQTLAELLAGRAGVLGTRVEVAPALDGAERDALGTALPLADLVLVCLDARQLLAREEREAIREWVLGATLGEVALVVLHLDAAEDPDDRNELRERARRFAAKAGHADLPLFFPGDPDDATAPAALEAFVAAARARAAETREAGWLRKVDALLRAIAGTLAAGGAATTGWREASAEERAEMAHALRQEHALALVQAEALLASRFAGLRAGLGARLAVMPVQQLQHEGVGELVAEVQSVARETGRAYLDAFERGLTARAPQPLRRAAEGFKPHASAHLDRDLAGADADVEVETRRDRHAMLMALTAVGAGLVLFTGGLVGPLLGALSLAGAHGLRLDVDERHDARVRANAAQLVEAWTSQAETALRAQLHTSADLVLGALQSRVETAMAAPVVAADAPADTPHALLALVRQAQALCQEVQDA